VGHQPDPGFINVPPPHWDFADLATPCSHQQKKLYIEGKTVNSLHRRNSTSEIAVKEFEPTLGISDPLYREDLNREIEDPSHEIAVPGLRPFNPASIDSPGSDGNPIGKILVQNTELLDGGCLVGVTEQNGFAPGGAETGPDGGSLAAVSVMNQTLECDAFDGLGRTRNLGSLIAGPVVDDDDFSRQPPWMVL